MTSPVWSVQPGDTLIREQIHGTYGGNPQAGISRSGSTPNVFVYSDHEKAAANGYDFDGWDESKQVYFYTGEGKVGDQQMVRGNKAIADHQVDGTALRLFIAVGNQPGSTTRIHRCIGEFAFAAPSERDFPEAPAPDRPGEFGYGPGSERDGYEPSCG